MLATGHSIELNDKGIDIVNNSFNDYYRNTRYIPFMKIIETIKKYKLNSCLDIATASGHFVYLARKNDINCFGSDLMILDKDKDLFKQQFDIDCLFTLDLNQLHKTNLTYDVITNFHLTHVFDESAFKQLLEVMSNISSYAILHISKNNIKLLNNCNFIKLIEIIDFKDYNNDLNWAFIKFENKINVPNIKNYIRPNYNIILSNN